MGRNPLYQLFCLACLWCLRYKNGGDYAPTFLNLSSIGVNELFAETHFTLQLIVSQRRSAILEIEPFGLIFLNSKLLFSKRTAKVVRVLIFAKPFQGF